MALENDAVSAAIASASADLGVSDPTPVVDTPVDNAVSDPTPEPTADLAPEPVADPAPAPAPADDEEPLNLTAKQLEEINANPLTKKAYNQMRKALTQKTMALAETRKTLEEKAAVADWIQADPRAAVRVIANATGMSIREAEQAAQQTVAAVDALTERWKKTVGPGAADLLKPLFEDTARALFDSQIRPYQEKAEALEKASQLKGLEASAKAFGASIVERGEEWDDELQADMAKLVGKVQPGKDTTVDEYLDIIYDKAIAQRHRTRSLRTQVARLRETREVVEPTTASRQPATGPVGPKVGMKDNDAVAAAVLAAQQMMKK